VIKDLSGSWCIKGTGESMSRVDSPVSLMHHDPDRSWITDPDLDHPKGTQPKCDMYIKEKKETCTKGNCRININFSFVFSYINIFLEVLFLLGLELFRS